MLKKKKKVEPKVEPKEAPVKAACGHRNLVEDGGKTTCLDCGYIVK